MEGPHHATQLVAASNKGKHTNACLFREPWRFRAKRSRRRLQRPRGRAWIWDAIGETGNTRKSWSHVALLSELGSKHPRAKHLKACNQTQRPRFQLQPPRGFCRAGPLSGIAPRNVRHHPDLRLFSSYRLWPLPLDGPAPACAG